MATVIRALKSTDPEGPHNLDFPYSRDTDRVWVQVRLWNIDTMLPSEWWVAIGDYRVTGGASPRLKVVPSAILNRWYGEIDNGMRLRGRALADYLEQTLRGLHFDHWVPASEIAVLEAL